MLKRWTAEEEGAPRRDVNRAVPGGEAEQDDSDDDSDQASGAEKESDQAYTADDAAPPKLPTFKRKPRAEGEPDDAAPSKSVPRTRHPSQSLTTILPQEKEEEPRQETERTRRGGGGNR